MIAETLRNGVTECSMESHRHGIKADGAQTWHWRLQSKTQLTNGKLNKYRPRADKNSSQV